MLQAHRDFDQEREVLRGGCFCGDVRYEAAGVPFDRTNCHCSICRRTTGAPFVTWFSVARSQFRFTQGQPALFRSSIQGLRKFCPRCGSQLTFEHSDLPDEIDVTTCTLDDPERLPPDDNTRTSSRLAWIKLCDGLPEHREARPQSAD